MISYFPHSHNFLFWPISGDWVVQITLNMMGLCHMSNHAAVVSINFTVLAHKLF